MTLSILLFIILGPFLFSGLINRVKAFFAGRKGPRLLQPLYDFLKLLKKGEVISRTTTFVFGIAPAVVLGSAVSAAFVAPWFGSNSLLGFQGDLIFFISVLGLGKLFSVISAMDTGSSFEGMGASREVSYTSFIEPALFIVFFALSMYSGTPSFDNLFSARGSSIGTAVSVVGAAVFFIILLVESKRVPVDDPNTHLELTMIHEAMILDNSGPNLAFMQYAGMLKMLIFASLTAGFLLPLSPEHSLFIPAYLAAVASVAVLIGAIESLMARFRMRHIPDFVIFSVALAMVLLLAVLLFLSGRG